jgi:hypothetical protein
VTRNSYQAHYYRVMQNYELYPIVIRELLLSCFTCYNALGSSEQLVTSGYDQITFSCFHNCYRREMASRDALHQPAGVFMSNWLLTGMLQVRILFGEPH